MLGKGEDQMNQKKSKKKKKREDKSFERLRHWLHTGGRGQFALFPVTCPCHQRGEGGCWGSGGRILAPSSPHRRAPRLLFSPQSSL